MANRLKGKITLTVLLISTLPANLPLSGQDQKTENSETLKKEKKQVQTKKTRTITPFVIAAGITALALAAVVIYISTKKPLIKKLSEIPTDIETGYKNLLKKVVQKKEEINELTDSSPNLKTNVKLSAGNRQSNEVRKMAENVLNIGRTYKKP